MGLEICDSGKRRHVGMIIPAQKLCNVYWCVWVGRTFGMAWVRAQLALSLIHTLSLGPRAEQMACSSEYMLSYGKHCTLSSGLLAVSSSRCCLTTGSSTRFVSMNSLTAGSRLVHHSLFVTFHWSLHCFVTVCCWSRWWRRRRTRGCTRYLSHAG